jgi:uncharacterized membrane protein
VVPLIGAILGGLLGAGAIQLDRLIHVPTYWQYSSSTATTVLSAIVGATAALTGFVVTVTVLVVQMATGTFSARYMRLWYRDRMLKATLAVLVGTLTFAFALLRRIESDFVPDLGVTAAGLLVATSLVLFLIFFDRFIHRLRPVTVAALVARAGRRAFEANLREAAGPDAPEYVAEAERPAGEPTQVIRSTRAGAVQAIASDRLVRWARAQRCRLVLPHVVGDFVSAKAILVEVYGGKADGRFAERELRGMIALGEERTIQQDPAFALRIMVDIALMALSPAVNAPTTATQVIDYLGETLREVGATVLPGEAPRGDDRGAPGVVMRAYRWEDYLMLGVTEIRLYGVSGIQVMRRLRAMLEELEGEVLPEHRAAVSEELARLDAAIARHWGGSVDLDRASTSSLQGIGDPPTLQQEPVRAHSRDGG